MDDFSRHLKPLPRRQPLPLAIDSVGYLPEKNHRIRYSFRSFNFSFILKGEGTYLWQGKMLPVIAPCVITQWPGVATDYGPQSTWEELYLIYDKRKLPILRQSKYALRDRPVWYMRDTGIVRRKIAELMEMLAGGQYPRQIDRIDRLCESLIMESLLAQEPPPACEHERKIQAIRTVLDEQYLEGHDFDELAISHGFSPTSFRRYWGRFVGSPPGKYVMRLRIRQACRLLAETSMPIGEIALKMQFDDQLYFSRKFRSLIGMTATEYRQRYRNPHMRLK